MKYIETNAQGERVECHGDVPTLITDRAGDDPEAQFDLLCKLVHNLIEVLPTPLAKAALTSTFPNVEFFVQ